MFDKKSRYSKLKTYTVLDPKGRSVKIVPVPESPNENSAGMHLMKQGQRLDHLAKKYLEDPTGYWRICELNDVMLPETLTETEKILIPKKRF